MQRGSKLPLSMPGARLGMAHCVGRAQTPLPLPCVQFRVCPLCFGACLKPSGPAKKKTQRVAYLQCCQAVSASVHLSVPGIAATGGKHDLGLGPKSCSPTPGWVPAGRGGGSALSPQGCGIPLSY